MKARTIKKHMAAFTAAAMLGTSAIWSALAYESEDITNSFTFTDTGITALTDEGGYKIDGTDLTINAAGTYVISGECAEGTIKVKKGTTDVVLILDSLTLTSSTSSPVSINKTASATIILEGESTITDAEDPANETSADEEISDAFEGAAIKVKAGASLTILGEGTLTADGSSCKNAIKGGATSAITIGSTTDSPTIVAKAANTGIAADGTLNIINGDITVTADNDGIKSSPDDDDAESAGVLNISGGKINVTAGDDGIKGQTQANITGGTITVSAADDGIKSDYTLNIGVKDSETGPDITIVTSYEGFEGATVNLFSGSGSIYAADDGINAANGDLTNYDFTLNIYGGEWYVNAEGDGLDSNGNINVYGGVTDVYSSSQNDNNALDFGDNGNGLYVYGGSIAGVGTSGMATVPTTGSYVVFGSSGMGGGMQGSFGGRQGGFPGQQGGQNQQTSTGSFSLTKGDTIAIKDSSGNTVWTGTATKSANHIVYASSDIISGESYSLYINGTEVTTTTGTEGTGQTSSQPGQPGNPGEQGGNQPGQPGEQGGDPSQRVAGDANNDGSVSVADVLVMQQYLANWNVTINEMNADVNGDRQVTVADVLLIQQKLANWNVELM